MNLRRRQLLLSTVGLALACSGCGDGGGGVVAVTPPPPPPPPPPAPTPTPTPTPTPSSVYPSYNTSPLAADSSGMTSTAVDIAARIKLGWNAGNTLEAIGGETAWGNPMIDQAQMDKIKSLGFDAVRLPCSWDQYSDKVTAKISDTWLNRVKTVVQYCMNANLYVLLNIHWDGGWLENHITAADKSAVIAKQKAFWEQIATHLRDFDERLMFASANEPNASNAAEEDILLSYHQTFVDAVRSTGGKNAYRTLVIQAPQTNTELAVSIAKKMPNDTATSRLMFEVHFYSPPNFCILNQDASWGKMFYYWGKNYHSTIEPDRNATFAEEDYVDQQMAAMKQNFVNAGIPVLLGEYGCPRRTQPLDLAMHNASVDHWMKYVTQQATANGVLPFIWDTGGLIDRGSLTVKDQRGLDALLQGAGKP